MSNLHIKDCRLGCMTTHGISQFLLLSNYQKFHLFTLCRPSLHFWGLSVSDREFLYLSFSLSIMRGLSLTTFTFLIIIILSLLHQVSVSILCIVFLSNSYLKLFYYQVFLFVTSLFSLDCPELLLTTA